MRSRHRSRSHERAACWSLHQPRSERPCYTRGLDREQAKLRSARLNISEISRAECRIGGQRMTATGTRMTADELLRLADNGMRRELIAGELHEMPPAGGEHGYVSNRAGLRLGMYLEQHPEIGGGLFAAETGFRLSRNPD